MADLMSNTYESDLKAGETAKYDPDTSKCYDYKKGQDDACTCVAKDEFKSATEDKLKSFYKKYNSEKLDASGEIKDLDEVWSKWKGKEPELIMALTTKYKAKAVDIRQKPKPPPCEPPPKNENDDMYEPHPQKEVEEEGDKAAPPPTVGLDAEDEAFETKLKGLLDKKKQAAADEDYDIADKAKEQVG